MPFAVHTSHPVVRPNDADLDEVAAIINVGQQIAIYGGSGCRGAHDEILRVAEILKAPIAHTSRGKDSLEYDNPYNVGMTGLIGNEAAYHAVLKCDKIVQIDLEPTHLGRRYPVTRGLVGDIKATLDALIPRLHEKSDTRFRDRYVERHREVIANQKEKAAPRRRDSISGIYLTELIDRMAADDALVAGDDGTATVWMHRYFTATAKRRFYASLLHGNMAAAMRTALGLQKAAPGRQVIALSGDGGIGMLFGDLMTAVQHKLRIKVAVFNNGKLGFIDIEQKSEGLLPLYTHLQNPDFGAVAKAMGLWGRTVAKVDELEAAIGEWLAYPGPALLDVNVEPMTLVMPPAIEFGPAYGMALYSARAMLGGAAHDLIEMIKENI
jgi:pyruvate dehydrogenase (quinone)